MQKCMFFHDFFRLFPGTIYGSRSGGCYRTINQVSQNVIGNMLTVSNSMRFRKQKSSFFFCCEVNAVTLKKTCKHMQTSMFFLVFIMFRCFSFVFYCVSFFYIVFDRFLFVLIALDYSYSCFRKHSVVSEKIDVFENGFRCVSTL